MTSESQPVAGQDTSQTTSREQSTWAVTQTRPDQISNWLTFSGTLLLLVGIFNLISGLTSLFRADYFFVASGGLLVFDYATWGWIWLALGVLQAAVGLGALAGQTWARVTGVVLASLCAIGHLAFLNAFPVWSLLVIALSVLVIYALVAPSANASGVA
ncbi:DUF7144 family membrane protein [Parasphingorhabdus pacifica]